MYRYSQQVRQNLSNSRARARVLAVLLVLSLAGCIYFGIAYSRERSYHLTAQQQLAQRIRSSCISAKTLADKLPSSVQSDTASRLAQIRQSVHAMDQLNAVSIALDGESGRIIPAEAMDALYADLDTYFSIIQTNTTSVLETRTLLINHLGALQALLSQ